MRITEEMKSILYTTASTTLASRSPSPLLAIRVALLIYPFRRCSFSSTCSFWIHRTWNYCLQLPLLLLQYLLHLPVNRHLYGHAPGTRSTRPRSWAALLAGPFGPIPASLYLHTLSFSASSFFSHLVPVVFGVCPAGHF